MSHKLILSFKIALSPQHCDQRPGGLAQAGLPLPLGRAQNLQIRTNFQASHCPACAKPLVGRRHLFVYLFHGFIIFSI
jgi:hypothetical protein